MTVTETKADTINHKRNTNSMLNNLITTNHNSNNKTNTSCYKWCGFLCLKYYRAPRYRMRCVTIVLVERRCTGCKINDLRSWKQRIFTKT